MNKKTATAVRGDAVQAIAARVGLWLAKVLGVLVGPLALLWWGAGYLRPGEARLFVAALGYLLPVMFLLGMQYGKTEARGFLGGIDTALGKLAAAIDLRDNTRARAAAQRQALNAQRPASQAQFNVYLPDPAQIAGAVPITHRQIAGHDDVVDL